MFVRMILLRGKMKIIVLFEWKLSKRLGAPNSFITWENKYFFFDNDETKWVLRSMALNVSIAKNFCLSEKIHRFLITTRLAEQIIENLVKLGFNNSYMHAPSNGVRHALSIFIILQKLKKHGPILIRRHEMYRVPGAT